MVTYCHIPSGKSVACIFTRTQIIALFQNDFFSTNELLGKWPC